MLLSAVFVVVYRLLGPLTISWDQGIQLDAAFRFSQGLGITNSFSSQLEINQSTVSNTLLHFPPGYSILVSLLLLLKIPLAISLKIIYGLTTLVGWGGWAIIASRCLTLPIKMAQKSIPGHLLIAFILPIFYTPPWMGTDIFLWAGVPIIVVLLSKKIEERFSLPLTVLASILIGILLSFRYASVFLLPTAILMICWIDYPKFRSMLLRCSAFIFLYAAIAISAILYFISTSGIDFVAVSFKGLLMNHGARYLDQNWFEQISKALSGFTHLYYLAGISIGNIQTYLENNSLVGEGVGLFFILLISALLAAVFNYGKNQQVMPSQILLMRNDFVFLLSCLMTAFLLTSTALTFIISYNPLIIPRYYIPVELSLIFIAYRSINLIDLNLLAKKISRVIIFIFLLFNFIVKPAYAALDDSKSLASIVLTGYADSISKKQEFPYPSNEFLFKNEESLNYLLETKNQNPNSLYFVHAYAQYMAHPAARDLLEIRNIPDSAFWQEAFLSEPARVYWVIDTDLCASICASSGNFNADDPEDPIPELESLPNLETVFLSTQEGTQIFKSDLPAGYRFSIN